MTLPRLRAAFPRAGRYVPVSIALHVLMLAMLDRGWRFTADAVPAATRPIEAALLAPSPALAPAPPAVSPPRAAPSPSAPRRAPVPPRVPDTAAATPAAAAAPSAEPMTSADLMAAADLLSAPDAPTAPHPAPAPRATPPAAETADTAPAETASAPEPVAARSPVISRWPPNGSMKFKVEAVQRETRYYGAGELRWQVDAGRYRVEQTTGIDLLITTLRLQSSISEGSVASEGLAPDRYTEQRRNRPTVATNFNREAEKRTISFSSTSKTVPLADGAQDRASVLFQLAGLLASQDDPRTVERMEVLLAGTRYAEPWIFSAAGAETVHTGVGEMAALRFVREPRPQSYESRIEIWYAAASQWYPARIRYTERNGDVIDLVLDALDIGTAPAPGP